jgi:Protein of unknown function C-terminus (DUF2399)
MVIVENLQAAETLADQRHDLGVIYTAGVPSDHALALIGRLAEASPHVLLVPDADLGGVRIAERVLRAAPAAEVIDIGSYSHPTRTDGPPTASRRGG